MKSELYKLLAEKLKLEYSCGKLNFSQLKKKLQRLNRRILSVVIIVLCFVGSAYARTIDTIIVHHTGADDVDMSAEEIDRYHKDRGWDEIGYHYVIRRNGHVEFGRDDEKQGAHASGRNATSLGIALSGCSVTLKQVETLYNLLHNLCHTYDIKHIERHHEECPGDSVNIELIESMFIQ